MEKLNIKFFYFVLRKKGLTASEKVVCSVIHTYAEQNGCCTLSFEDMGAITAIPVSTISKKINKLIGLSLNLRCF